MGLVPVRTDSSFSKRITESTRLIERTPRVDNRSQGGSRRFCASESSATTDKIVLSRDGMSRTGDEYTVLVVSPQKDNQNNFYDKLASLSKALFSLETVPDLFTMDSESIRDRYTIDQYALKAMNLVMHKYQQAQASRYWTATTVEVYA